VDAIIYLYSCILRFFCIMIFNIFPIYFVALGKETYDFFSVLKNNHQIKKYILFL